MKVPNTLLTVGLMAAMSPVAHLSVAQTLKPVTPVAASAPTAVPALIPYAGAVMARDGSTFAPESGVTFQIYKDEVGGEALWVESQIVAIDPTGHYKVQLGAANPSGLPSELFLSGEARWLEVQISGQEPQPRVLLVSVPYALKAADSATLGGLPASAFVLARSAAGAVGESRAVSTEVTPNVTSNVTTTGGTPGFVPEFAGTSSVVDSPVFVGTSGSVGIGTTTPTATLDVNGTAAIEGQLLLPASGTATAAKKFNSQALKLSASAFNSSTNTVVAPRFGWEAEATGNNTSAPGATLNLQSSTSSAAPTETGFYFNSNGTLHFAPGQTFPGTGTGTITGVTAGTALTGGGTAGTVTLNVDTTKVPLLASNNTFIGNQAVSGTETVSGNVAVGASLLLPNTSSANIGVVKLGTTPFLSNYGPANGDNAFIGGAGNFTMTGEYNTGTGFDALMANTSGVANTADGSYSLLAETNGTANTAFGFDSISNTTTGNFNTGLGYAATYFNTTGSYNTGVGELAGPDSGSPTLSNTTAVGANATVSQSNTLVLGRTTAGMPGASFVNVGVGTATPISAMEMSVSAPEALGPVLTLTNPGDTGNESGAAVAIDFNTTAVPSTSYYPSDRIEAVDNGSGSADLQFLTGGCCGLTEVMGIYADGEVHVESQFTVAGNQEFNVESLAFNNDDAFYGAGGDGAFSSSNGGNGGDFYGGTAGGSGGRGGYGIYASQGFANGGPSGMAGVFEGNVQVYGTLSATVKNFKIDDPLDPANKYLVHSSIESSEMVNIYSGNAVTDELGLATVKLPEWFEAENGDFRYQLTVVGGQFAQAIVSKEIHDHEFTISTNATRVKVSWQVTGVRQDAYAKAHPMVVEEAKDEKERGFYIHPDVFGQPEEKQIEWGHRPESMRRMKALRDKATRKQKIGAKPGQLPRSTSPASAVTRNFPHPAGPAISRHATGAQLKPISRQ